MKGPWGGGVEGSIRGLVSFAAAKRGGIVSDSRSEN